MADFKKNKDSFVGEVRVKKSSLYIEIPILLLIELITIVMLQIAIAIMMGVYLAYIMLDYFNHKILYDDKGLTFCDFLGRKWFCSWDDIVSIEDTMQDPRLSRGAPGRILRIRYRNKNKKIESIAYDYVTYTGLFELDAYYISRQG